ncbi:MAG: Beta-barrel assembly-enhancing protease [Fimbriimonadaceae bacterium]|nr:Beta-barrel assembly-enhancing protease [Fimbriimonadaceae bacterium]
MTIAVLPFNAGPKTNPALARQFTNFACEIVRQHTDAELQQVAYLAQLENAPGRMVFVNPSEQINENQLIEEMFRQSNAQHAIDGLLVAHEDGRLNMTVRTFKDQEATPAQDVQQEFTSGELFAGLRNVVKILADLAGAKLPDDYNEDINLFGTTDPQAMSHFLQGYDTLQYIEKTQGQVAPDFNPHIGMASLLQAIRSDAEWEGPYLALVNLCRLCVTSRIGNADEIDKILTELNTIVPDDWRGIYSQAELQAAMGNNAKAADLFEKCLQYEVNESGIYTRLGLAQMAAGMPVNAERNLRKAIELEAEDKPSLDILGQVLAQTGRIHELPPMWKEIVDKFPQNASARAKYAIALVHAGKFDEGVKEFERGIAEVPEHLEIKRAYAPILAGRDEATREDLDKALDFYEDSLDESPADVQLLLEYAQTLQRAERTFEVPKVLNDVLSANPDPNTRANVQAWKLEIEQEKRVEAVKVANDKLVDGDPAGALDALKPVKNWLVDYWKMWAIMATAQNQLGQHKEAEETSNRLIQLFPGCEPAYAELSDALLGQGRAEEAYNVLRYAIENVGRTVPLGLKLAFAAKNLGKADEAKMIGRQIRESIGGDIDPNLDQVLRQLEA